MRARLLVVVLLLACLAACGGGGSGGTAAAPSSSPTPSSASPTPSPTPSPPAPSPSSSPSSSPSASPSVSPAPTRPPLGTVPPPWLGTRPLPVDADGIGLAQPTPPALRDRRFTLPDQLPPLPGSGFRAEVTEVPPGVLSRSTWSPACPVGAGDLRWVRLTFWGFDDRRHTGELLVNASAADDLVSVFRTLYDARFPIEQMRISTAADLAAAPTGDGDNTESFVCRPTVGQTTWSQHAYGLAIDVDPFQNPYIKGDRVIPELATAYVDRGWRRPGMIEPGGVVVRAFDRIGWTWGGTWSSLLDLQHFSANGR